MRIKSNGMKAFVIEDEPIARVNLVRMLTQNFPDMEIVGTAGSVREAVAGLSDKSLQVDVIFMDVELSDGDCFEIFRQVKIDSNVIMTTAYDNYAVKAFEINSIDYLLKPIDPAALRRAVDRCRAALSKVDISTLAHILRQPQKEAAPNQTRKRFIVRFNDNIVPISCSEVAYFWAGEKNTYMMTKEGTRYVMDWSLDIISEDLDRRKFFRISRNCIVAMDAIESITKQMGGRLKISARPNPPFEMTVSRSRINDFLEWLEG